MKRFPLSLDTTRRFSRPAALALIWAIGLIGCGSEPLRPQTIATDPSLESRGREHRERGFFPLATGNRWSYRVTDTVDDGTNPPTDFHYRFEYEVLGRESRGGRDYSVLEVQLFLPPYEFPFVGRLLLRQDGAGLYQRILPVERVPLALERLGEAAPFASTASRNAVPGIAAEASGGSPAALHAQALRQAVERRLTSLPGAFSDHRRRSGPADSERVILRYPLHRGARWAPSPGEPKVVVVDRDGVKVPAGWFRGYRLRLLDLTAHFEWYGRDGFLKERARTRILLPDPLGNLMWVEVRSLVELESLDLD